MLAEKFALPLDELPLLELYRRHAEWVEVEPLDSPVCRDRDDDCVLAAAHAGASEAVVTGDEVLLCVGAWKGVAVLSSRGFLERLPSRGGTDAAAGAG